MMSLDLEMNQPSKKIIQVGACVFKPRNCEIVEKFMVYVNPHEPIGTVEPHNIVGLTGITDAHVAQGTSVEKAYELLRELSQKHKCMMNPVVWGSGVFSDSSELYKQGGSKEPNFMGHRVTDAKTLYQSWRMIDNKKVKGGLENAMIELGLEFEGRAHDALADAINTARVWCKLSDALKRGLKAQAGSGR
jgi:inhibitor of KinA sporulation pathway (predicted exonuclease)